MVMKYSTLKLNKLIQRYENTEQCAMCLEGETVNRRKPLKYRSKARSENETLESVTVTTTKNLRQNRARKKKNPAEGKRSPTKSHFTNMKKSKTERK